ncbi:hypothetical protein Ahy_B01g056354 [Arachis hypogaea]|uniref:DUF4283 domain-containing protein n=1 Tax=Arachis hypogaea TaxID=3818 RepID=A0A445AYQ3_ARAHY|nr:hypothetical protein Ahy_B01g056354 [Arachis hypogaea]
MLEPNLLKAQTQVRPSHWRTERSTNSRLDCINLVGKIISNKELPFKIIKNTLLGIWGNPEGISISAVERNKILVSIKDMGKGLQILNGRPWSIRGQIFNLQIWSQGISVHEVAHDYLEFWVQIPGLPQEYINADTARDIGNRMGIVAEVEDPRVEEVLERTFLRVKVAIDVSKPLPTRF